MDLCSEIFNDSLSCRTSSEELLIRTESYIREKLIKVLEVETLVPGISGEGKHSAKMHVQIRTNPEKCFLKFMKQSNTY